LANLYHILGVSPTATGEEIKRAYRSLAMRHHPDRNTSPGADKHFNAINLAYELLSDTKKRAEYDQSLNNRIVLDPHDDALKLWKTLLSHYGLVPDSSH
jgi:molecular chaperone DnaJ